MTAMPLLLLLATVAGDCTAVWGRVVNHPPTSAADTVRVADSLATSGTRCDRAVAAYLMALTTTDVESSWRSRVAVEELLDQAYLEFPNEPRVFFAYGYLKYRQRALSDADRLLDRAIARTERADPPLTRRERAVIAYVRGLVAQDRWRDWRSYGHLISQVVGLRICETPDPWVPLTGMVDMNVACPREFEELMDRHFRLDAALAHEKRTELEHRFRESVRWDPSYWPAAEALASELAFEEEWDALYELADELGAHFPGDFRPLTYRALALYERGSEDASATLFDSALAMMPAPVRATYDDAGGVLRTAERTALEALPDHQRQLVTDAYWRSQEVLFLTDLNERRYEHYARTTAAGLIFGEPTTGRPGWNTKAGNVWIRYGRPKKIRDLGPDPTPFVTGYRDLESARISFWSYGPDPDFVFARNLTYYSYREHPEAAPQADLTRERVPTRFRPRYLDSVISLPRQVVRFRSEQGPGADVLVVAPFDYPGDSVDVGVTLLDAALQPAAKWRRGGPSRDGFFVTIRGVRPGDYSLVVEAWNHTRRFLAQGRDTLAVGFADSVWTASDLLLLSDLTGTDGATGRADVAMEYLYGAASVTEPLTLLWETYPPRQSASVVQYEVQVQVRDSRQRPLLARVIRGIAGLRDRPQADVQFQRSVAPANGRVLDWITKIGLDLEQAIRQLDPKYRAVFLLREVEGYSYEDVADVLGIRVGRAYGRPRFGVSTTRRRSGNSGWCGDRADGTDDSNEGCPGSLPARSGWCADLSRLMHAYGERPHG